MAAVGFDGRDKSSKVTLRQRLQAAVQSINWTYAVFWRPSLQQGELVWADGYYNGSVKTRKTIIVRERSPEEYGLQRSDQLRELFESLSSSTDASQTSTRRPTAALSPEDLTDTEWFYLVCMSCTFDSGSGIPGQAYTKGRPVWLCKANEASTKVFSRALLAKTARIQTVVCIPLAEGVLEVGSTNLVREDTSIVQQIVSFFIELSKPTLSEQSISSSQSGENGHEELKPASKPEDESERSRSAFFHWKASQYQGQPPKCQQRMLKNVLRVPLMYGREKREMEARKTAENGGESQKNSASRKDEDMNTAHAMLERRRREKLNERFIVLRKLVPFVTKMDKASILGDTIEYLKQLRKRVSELEKCKKRLEAVLRSQGMDPHQVELSGVEMARTSVASPSEPDSFLEMEVEVDPASPGDSIPTSSTSKDQSFDIHVLGDTTSLEVQCASRKGIIFDILMALSDLNLEVSTIQASSDEKVFRGHMKAEVKNLSAMLRPSEEDIDDVLRRTIAHSRASVA